MALKTLEYAISADGVSPNYERKAGVQYDHKKTALQFNLTSEFYDEIIGVLSDGQATYRFDCYDGEGTLHLGEQKELTGITLKPYELEYWVTKFGGKLKINLVISIINNDTTAKEWSYEVVVYLTDLPESDIDEKQYQSMATLTLRTTAIADKVDEKYKKILSIHQELSTLENMLQNGEWVFDGETGSEIDVKYIVDEEFNSNSNNAVANKVITERFTALDNSLSQISESIGQTVYDSIVSEIKIEILSETHPIGSYYWSENPINPAVLFGGTWERIKDMFVLAAGDKYGCNTTGGEIAHKLVDKEMPQHAHMFRADVGEGDGVDFVVPTATGGTGVSSISTTGSAYAPGHWATRTWGTNICGGSVAHNNMPPYITAYCWKRIG